MLEVSISLVKRTGPGHPEPRPRGDTAALVHALDGVCEEIDPAVLCEPTTLAKWAGLLRLPLVAPLLEGFDALGLVVAPLLLVVIALVAAMIPGRRAMSADPVLSPRAD